MGGDVSYLVSTFPDNSVVELRCVAASCALHIEQSP